MADGLVGDQALVGEWDAAAGLWLARAGVPGPAGSAGLSLGQIELDVDVASPGVLAGLTVEAPDGDPDHLGSSTRIALARLLGQVNATALLSLEPGPAVRLPAGGAGRGRRPEQVHPGLSRAALARAAAADAPPLARGLALLEASAAASSLGGLAGLVEMARSDAGEGSRIIVELAASGALAVGSSRTAHELAAALRRAATLLGPRPEVVDLASDLDRGRYGPRPDAAAAAAASPGGKLGTRSLRRSEAPAAAAPVAAAPMAAAPRLRLVTTVPVDRSFLPPGVDGGEVEAAVAGAAEVEVQLSGAARRATGWWARATAPDGTTLALAPVVDAGADAAARLLVPPAAVGALEIDLTTEPGSPRVGPRLTAAQRAVRLGQAAARASRLGLPEATSRWAACAQAWNEAGDEARAARAADGSRSTEAGPALAVDDLLEA